MEFYEVINNRHIVRDWKDKCVSPEILERVISAGLKAPTHDHARNWEFIVLQNEQDKAIALQFVKAWSATQEEINAIFVMKTTVQKMYAYAMPRQYTMLQNAPYVIIPLFKGSTGIFHASSVNGLNSFASIWCVVENIFLAATAEGLACSMRIPVGEEGKKVTAALGVPIEYMMPCYIGIGYPVEDAAVPEQIDYTAEQKMHFGKW
ncbi:MAG: nitroreductase family protein [Oscillospiraceae bacterium]|nr:nitroreductase family protein [Oscillospiraceae bacterium]